MAGWSNYFPNGTHMGFEYRSARSRRADSKFQLILEGPDGESKLSKRVVLWTGLEHVPSEYGRSGVYGACRHDYIRESGVG